MINSANKAIIRGLLAILLLSGSGCNPVNLDSADSEEIGTEEILTTEEPINIEEDTWDLLWISDSSGWGVAEIYGEFIAEDNGVAVNVIDSWVSNLSVGKILQGLKSQDTHNASLDKLRDTIAEAEVIVIYGNPESSVNPENPGDWLCGQPGGGRCYVNNCDMDTFSQYIADLKEVYEIVFTLRQGKPTIIRAIDAINPGLVRSCDSEIRDTCTVCWETYNEAVHQAADDMGVPIAHAFDAWNGIDHNEDPVEKGYTQEDNIHPNELGATVIAQLLRELGYEPIVP